MYEISCEFLQRDFVTENEFIAAFFGNDIYKDFQFIYKGLSIYDRT